ncbi:glycosyltransferase family 2 protein [Escherichia coli]|uniref:glycosyltransferase family 2 protein n=1 Tax=Escherichia coli TaxID=562 RepID=UPI000BB600CD|nr:glycosyltransferase family 2 protein [Escherichia coli]EFB3997656.1 glycosyltransferase family 2 protein [Escherichia coli]EFC3517189.1 glycosyltransferase family 2 protein [Escherichia coli]EFN9502345.1 glycosyltransferase family 2 protein [Escherichia coli]EIO2238560.1 glycosyltransferase family 2 protein [Escherichia coli]MDH6970306.1 glycosyltransferase family 2 protein [Escherichia coli]
MVYIVVLNWNGWKDTLSCLDSLIELNYNEYKIVVCDNNSSNDSVKRITDWYESKKDSHPYLVAADYQYLDSSNLYSFSSQAKKGFYLIQTGSNLGFAGGNNVGLRFALNQNDMSHVWILNNDTVVEPSALSALTNKVSTDNKIGLCGSRMVYFHDRDKLQGIGGKYKPLLATTRHIAEGEPADTVFDERVIEKELDYVIGASMLITRACLEDVGLLSEDYFLYFEEFDYCQRLANRGYRFSIATDSWVYHKEGGSTESGRSVVSDFYQVRNRFIITKKYFPKYYIIVYFSMFGVLLNRLRKLQLKKAINIIYILFNGYDSKIGL